MTHLVSAKIAAREQRGDDAHAHLGEAASLSVRVGERNGMRQHLGPTNVALWDLLRHERSIGHFDDDSENRHVLIDHR
jgi:hypothetical protein